MKNEFEELVEAHYQPLYRFGYSLSKNADKAADLVQQTFCIWAEKGHQLKERSKAKTWLFTTLYREYLNQARKSKRFADADVGDLEYAIPAEESNVSRQMDADRAVELLNKIDETFKGPLTLFYLQQHSYKEIAEILEIPIGTVMSRISRGKSQLKKLMSDESQLPAQVIAFNSEKKKSNG